MLGSYLSPLGSTPQTPSPWGEFIGLGWVSDQAISQEFKLRPVSVCIWTWELVHPPRTWCGHFRSCKQGSGETPQLLPYRRMKPIQGVPEVAWAPGAPPWLLALPDPRPKTPAAWQHFLSLPQAKCLWILTEILLLWLTLVWVGICSWSSVRRSHMFNHLKANI